MINSAYRKLLMSLRQLFCRKNKKLYKSCDITADYGGTSFSVTVNCLTDSILGDVTQSDASFGEVLFTVVRHRAPVKQREF